jgi:uncharacterized membrane protein
MTDTDTSSTQTTQCFRQQHHQTPAGNVGTLERWASLLGGAALLAYGLKRRSLGGVALAVLGGGLAYRGLTGYCQLYQVLGIDTAKDGGEASTIVVEKAITIDKSPEELYRFWRQFENLPRFMAHLQSMHSTGGGRSHWVARAPLGMTAKWQAVITDDRPNELLAWRSLEGSHIPNHGRVRFLRAPGGRGTEVHVTLTYAPPLGKLGATVAKLFGEEPQQQLDDDLRRFKSLMETGEIPTTEGQPSVWVSTRRADPAQSGQRAPAPSLRCDAVEEASIESFPSSDAPSRRFRNEGA